MTPETLQSLTAAQARQVADEFGTPTFVYNEAILRDRATQALAFQAPFGLTVRYAMKANPLTPILRLFHTMGIHIDASSGFEAQRAIRVGIPAKHIMITSQELPINLSDLVNAGVLFNATSLHQLTSYGKLFDGRTISIRINPGIGSGHSRKTNTGGPTSSFGIWHEDIPEIKRLAAKYRLKITKIHTHIGAGTDPAVWHEAARNTLEIVEQFPDVTTVNLGGGFKIARMSYETATDLQEVSAVIAGLLTEFQHQTGRRLHLEIEPGTFLVANAGALVSRIIDTADTGTTGFKFLKLDTGLTEIMRPSLYGAQHAIIVINDLPADPQEYVVVGHTCESGDLLTPEPSEPDTPSTRLLQRASIGDLVVIEGAGAYCSSMSAYGYNSFPDSAEVMLRGNTVSLAYKPWTLEDKLRREL